MVKNPFASAGDAREVDSIPGSERPPKEENGNPDVGSNVGTRTRCREEMRMSPFSCW